MEGSETFGAGSVWSDESGSIPLRVAPMIILGLSVLVLVILYVTTTT